MLSIHGNEEEAEGATWKAQADTVAKDMVGAEQRLRK